MGLENATYKVFYSELLILSKIIKAKRICIRSKEMHQNISWLSLRCVFINFFSQIFFKDILILQSAIFMWKEEWLTKISICSINSEMI